MNQDSMPYVLRLAYGLWALVAVLIVTAWGVWLYEYHDGLPNMLALTACAVSAGAATAHIRTYMTRICAVARALGNDDADDRAPLRIVSR